MIRNVFLCCALLLLVACGTKQISPIDCGRDMDCYRDAYAKCSPAITILEYEDDLIIDSEIRGSIDNYDNYCNEHLTGVAPDAIAGLDAVCEVPMDLRGELGITDMCKYCEGSLISDICEEQ